MMGNVVQALRNVWLAFKLSYREPVRQIDTLMLFANVTREHHGTSTDVCKIDLI